MTKYRFTLRLDKRRQSNLKNLSFKLGLNKTNLISFALDKLVEDFQKGKINKNEIEKILEFYKNI